MITFFLIAFVSIVIIGAVNIRNNQSVQNKRFKEEGLDPLKFLFAGKYLSGHPTIDKPLINCYVYPKKDVVKIYMLDTRTGRKGFIANIDSDKIKNILIEDETTISSRVGLKRLVALGIFAFALKKKQKTELAYIVIEWNDGRFDHETVFEFEGADSVLRANTFRNQVIKSI